MSQVSNYHSKGRPWIREVLGQTKEGSARTAQAVERMFGVVKPTVHSVIDKGHRGTDEAYCPICSRKPSLLDVIPDTKS